MLVNSTHQCFTLVHMVTEIHILQRILLNAIFPCTKCKYYLLDSADSDLQFSQTRLEWFFNSKMTETCNFNCEKSGNSTHHLYRCPVVPKCQHCKMRTDLYPPHLGDCPVVPECQHCKARTDVSTRRFYSCPHVPKCQHCKVRTDIVDGPHAKECPLASKS